MSQCVFCEKWVSGVEFSCCNTFVCRECLQGEGWEKKGGGIFGGSTQVRCPVDNVWVDI